MTIDLTAVVAAARALWRRDRALLWPLSGLFVFLPQYAVLLLVPAMPDTDPGMSVDAWGRALEPWIARYGGWYVAATLLAQYGALACVSLYAAPARSVGAAMARAARLFPRALLAGLLVTMPCAIGVLLSLSVPALPLVALPAAVYVLARTTLATPAILGERGPAAAAAVARSWRLTRGHGVQVTLLVGAITIGGQALGAAAVAVERAARDGGMGSPAVLALVDALAAGVAWAAALALALVQVVLYRRFAR